jgi:hypothetical protein
VVQNTCFFSKILIYYICSKKGEIDMKSFADLLTRLAQTKLEISEGANGVSIKQTQRNQLKAEMLEALAEGLSDLGVTVAKVDKGYAISVPNEDEGSFTAVLDLTIKSMNYDMYAENEAILAKEQEKAEAVLARQREKEAKYKVAQETRAMKLTLAAAKRQDQVKA